MGLDISAKLMGCRNYTEAKPILETLGASKASHELMQLYFAQPENSPYRTRFLTTVVQEMEDGIDTEKHKGGPHDQGNGTGEKNTKEYEQTGTGTGHSSSDESPNNEGQDKGTVVGDSSAQPTENQMKEMPMMGMPGVPPEMQNQMMDSLAKQPPMNPLQQMKMMQYTIKEALKGPLEEIKGIKEALTKVDSKIQEMETNSVALEIPGGDKLAIPKLQETVNVPTQNTQSAWGMGSQPPVIDSVASKRMKIQEADRLMNIKKNGGDVSQMYQ